MATIGWNTKECWTIPVPRRVAQHCYDLFFKDVVDSLGPRVGGGAVGQNGNIER